MKFQDLPITPMTFRLKAKASLPGAKDGKPFPVKYVKSSEAVLGEFDMFTYDGVAIHAAPADKAVGALLDSELALGRSYLAQIQPVAETSDFMLEISFFFQKIAEMGEVEIAVDEYVAERFKDLYNAYWCKDVAQIREQMEQDFNFSHGGESYFFIVVGSALDSDLESAERAEKEIKSRQDSDEDLEEAPVFVSSNVTENCRAFGIVGRDVFFAAKEENLSGIGDIFIASKMTNRMNRSGRSVRLARGRLSFSDVTKTGGIAAMARAQVEALSQENSTYLKKWDKYGDEEGGFLLDKARRYGVLFYSGAEQGLDNTTTVQLVSSSAGDSAFREMAVSGIGSVDLVTEVPSYISNPELTFDEFVNELLEADRNLRESGQARIERMTYDVVRFNEGTNKLVLDTVGMPESGQLILSLSGDVTQIKRRVEARKRIKNCESANPQLALILEPGESVTSVRRPKPLPALNSFVKNKVFPKNPPTDSQLRAIDIALNTPDIALIQGPPGTGKTTVITAIVERLNQICAEKGLNVKGRILLSGFQHDAVENIIGRMSLNGLPCVPKFGKSSADKKSGKANIYESALEDWCQDIASKIRKANPKLDDAGKSTHTQMLALQYSKAPSASLATQLLEEIVDAPVALTGPSLRDRARKELSNQRELAKMGERDSLIPVVRLLRVKGASFLDDGPARAEDVLDELYDFLKPSERKLLSKASAWNVSKGVPPFMRDLAKLKAKLLERLSTPPAFHVDKPNEAILALAEEFIEANRKPRISETDEKLRVLSDFVTDLENNHYGMVDAVSEYSFAFAATCQQSSSMMMLKAKATDDEEQVEFVYEYVIVDEAARVSPRDLMIPMSQGEKIILVGDHRQLPHIIDSQVEDAIKRGNADMTDLSWLEKSMFEQLFTERVLELEAADGICRHVTLDTQFRMHPLLGDFISRNFYERYSGGAEKVKSGLPARFYAHNLPGTDNKPVAWIDVPRFKGKELKNENMSSYRRAEADAIVAQIDEWMASEAGSKLSYGVISFYKGQAELIEERLGSRVDGSKIRVGTVDSFQGMEFDVVFLSMVRTLPDNIETHPLGLTEIEEKIEVPVEKVVEEPQSRGGGLLGRFLRNRSEQTPASHVETIMESRIKTRSVYEPRPTVWPSEDPDEAMRARRLFGFLTMYNRLNVSMSREKKMMVVVGDSNLLKTDLSDKYIPGLVDFYLLCCSEGVMLPCK